MSEREMGREVRKVRHRWDIRLKAGATILHAEER